jgi:hypothetical protein
MTHKTPKTLKQRLSNHRPNFLAGKSAILGQKPYLTSIRKRMPMDQPFPDFSAASMRRA